MNNPKQVILFMKAARRIGNPGFIPTTIVDKNGKQVTVYKLSGERDHPRKQERRDIESLYEYAKNHPLAPPDAVRLVLGEQLNAVFEKGPAILGRNGEITVRGKALAAAHGSKSGYGMVKIIWRHGEMSSKAGTSKQVKKSDIMRLPHLLRDTKPIAENGQLTWNVLRHDGEVVCYALNEFVQDGGQSHVVSIHVHD